MSSLDLVNCVRRAGFWQIIKISKRKQEKLRQNQRPNNLLDLTSSLGNHLCGLRRTPPTDKKWKSIYFHMHWFIQKKRWRVQPTPDTTADRTIHFLISFIVTRHGVPIIVLSDNGKNFIAAAVKDMYELLGSVRKTSTPYNQTEWLKDSIEN